MASDTIKIDDTDFQFFTGFLKQTSGYHLVPEKRYLLETRLSDVIQKGKIADAKTLIMTLRSAPYGQLATEVIEAMTVNETFFFRDQGPFDVFEKKLLPQLAGLVKHRPLRIWSAACSTGQEPYSLAMIIEESRAAYPGLNFDIIATDINTRVLAKARQGIYSDLEVHRGLPESYRNKYFTRDGTAWRVVDSVRKHIVFRPLNLREQYDIDGQFDFVLLRNVLIYFDAKMKEEILSKVAKKMHPHGLLLLGAAEGIYDPAHYFQRCPEMGGLYRFKPAG